ncbi:hypothetical protein BV22DRAFT_1132100 [Leucogyrophana mollusca]|uniref:Uncharacterized protein n=1 Tax=Leucogyrophana mollusca TaxID=85980 RepID=A0ACB8B792_9AGAM|nr:hypothetical protein BV22DRAFT_1132100 [Leucogyrophana mollusca]
MKFSVAFTGFCIAAVHAVPTKRDAAPTAVQILNYALTLEHLENAFYAQGLQKYSQQDFVNAGLPDFARGRWSEIAAHEATHVSFLQTALGDAATKPCTYKFPDTDPKSFAAVSYLLENVGTSAYSGAAQYLSDGTLTAAAAILAVEARHGAWVNSAVLKANPWNTAFDTPLDLNQIYTLASSVISSCPSSNPTLPVKAFPALTFTGTVKAGATADVSYKAASTSNPLFVAFISGLSSTIVPLNDNKVAVPSGLEGVVYAIVTSDAEATSDNVTIAGPAFLSFDFDSNGQMMV